MQVDHGFDVVQQVADDEDVGVLDQLLVHAIEYIDVCEEDWKVVSQGLGYSCREGESKNHQTKEHYWGLRMDASWNAAVRIFAPR